MYVLRYKKILTKVYIFLAIFARVGRGLTFSKSSYIMAAIDRVVHHSVILDMMGVESYRAKEAN